MKKINVVLLVFSLLSIVGLFILNRFKNEKSGNSYENLVDRAKKAREAKELKSIVRKMDPEQEEKTEPEPQNLN